MLIKRPWLLVSLGLATGLLLALFFGSLRYGGVGGLYLRVRAEFPTGAREAYVPTPLPTATPTATVVVPPTATIEQPSPSPSVLPSATATLAPTSTPSPTDTPAPTPTTLYIPAKPSVALAGLRHEWQTWNNCGPASLSMLLSYYGLGLTQANVAAVIHPDMDVKHVGIPQLAAFAHAQGLATFARVNGDADLLRLLLSNDLPVITPTWHVDAKGTGMGHYRLLTGYDEALGEWIIYDSLESRGVNKDQPYHGIRLSFQQFEEWWQVMNYAYLVVYPEEKAPLVEAIIGDQLDDQVMWQSSLERARNRVEERTEDAFAWFTWGTNLVGNGLFEDAAAAYDRARTIGLPYRMLWYQSGPFKAYYEVGRLDEVLALADATIETADKVAAPHYWRGRALESLGDAEGARQALEKALSLRPGYPEDAEP